MFMSAGVLSDVCYTYMDDTCNSQVQFSDLKELLMPKIMALGIPEEGGGYNKMYHDAPTALY